MNELTTNMFENKPIRIVNLDGDAWFVAKDVCAFFGDKNYKRSLRNLDEDEKGVTQMNTPGGNQELSIVSEGGLFRLLLQMKPQKARGVSQEYIDTRMKKLIDFQRWITHEVLPAIRRTGSYSTSGQEKEGKLDKNIKDAIAARDKLIASKKESDEQYKQELERFNNLIDREEVKALLPKMPHTLVVEILNLARLKYGLYVKTQKNPELPGGEA